MAESARGEMHGCRGLGSTVAWIEKRRRSAEADDVDLLVAGGGEPNLAACDFEGARAELGVGRAAKPRPRLNARRSCC